MEIISYIVLWGPFLLSQLGTFSSAGGRLESVKLKRNCQKTCWRLFRWTTFSWQVFQDPLAILDEVYINKGLWIN